MNQKEQHLELIREDIQTYRSIENWTLTLSLTAILVASAYLLEWEADSKSVSAIEFLRAVPSLIGLFAFCVLLLTNCRGRERRAFFLELAEGTGGSISMKQAAKFEKRAILGWIFALTPLLIGLICSSYVVNAGTCWLTSVAVISVCITTFAICYDEFHKQSSNS